MSAARRRGCGGHTSGLPANELSWNLTQSPLIGGAFAALWVMLALSASVEPVKARGVGLCLTHVPRWQVLGQAPGLLSRALSILPTDSHGGRSSTGCIGGGIPCSRSRGRNMWGQRAPWPRLAVMMSQKLSELEPPGKGREMAVPEAFRRSAARQTPGPAIHPLHGVTGSRLPVLETRHK